MKKNKKFIIWAIVLFALFLTNPNKNDLINAFAEKANSLTPASAKDEGGAIGAFGNAFATALIKPVLESTTTSQDFIFFTLFKTTIAGQKVTSLGILKHFVIFKSDGKIAVL